MTNVRYNEIRSHLPNELKTFLKEYISSLSKVERDRMRGYPSTEQMRDLLTLIIVDTQSFLENL